MSKNFCCVTWGSLSKELAAHKHGEIADFVNTKGLPASMFAPIVEVLLTMQNFCPSCGTRLNGAAPKAQALSADIETQAAVVPKKQLHGKCRICYGYGTSSKRPRETEDETSCINCHGTGKINDDTISEHKVDPAVMAALEAKEEQLRKEQKGKVINVTLPENDDPDA